jgi:hypothetical protein
MICSAVVTVASQEAREGPVWFWFATCGGPLMTLEVRLDNQVVYKSTFPLCRANRESVERQGQAGRIEFKMRPSRAIVWKGYRDTTDRSVAGKVLDVDVWEAGADPDALILGVSVVSGKRILMNTVHISHPDQRDESEIAKGLSVRTYPADK